jgi:hypothetical protein
MLNGGFWLIVIGLSFLFTLADLFNRNEDNSTWN